MVSIEDLHEQNHQIGELAKTLNYLFQDREMCGTSVTCELFERYMEKFDTHMSHNKAIYSALLASGDNADTAQRFLQGEKEIKKIFKSYADKWCKNGMRVGNHEEFLQETEEMFEMVWKRIQAESEQLYPLARGAGAP